MATGRNSSSIPVSFIRILASDLGEGNAPFLGSDRYLFLRPHSYLTQKRLPLLLFITFADSFQNVMQL
jgi:hypothetical protein